jgi:hypothetical protein
MYQWHEAVTAPTDDKIIWRYMSLTKYVDFLHRRQLYLCRIDKFDDPWEGIWTDAYTESSATPNYLDEEKPLMNKFYKRQYIVSCWHMSDFESVAMWKIYCSEDDGVAIKSTIGSLIRSLDIDQSQKIHIGQVSYIADHSTYKKKESPTNYWGPLPEICKKRKFFEYENEVRIIQDNYSNPELESSYANLSFEFINEIRLSPRMGEMFLDTVKAVSEKFGVRTDLIKRSTIYDNPPNS